MLAREGALYSWPHEQRARTHAGCPTRQWPTALGPPSLFLADQTGRPPTQGREHIEIRADNGFLRRRKRRRRPTDRSRREPPSTWRLQGIEAASSRTDGARATAPTAGPRSA